MIHIHDSNDGKFYYTVTARNGKVLVVSETYTRKDNAINGALALIEVLSDMERNGLQLKEHKKSR